LNSAILLLVAPFSTASWSHALVAAGLAAVLTLLARLYKLRPDTEMVSYIALVAFLVVLVLILPGAWALGQSITASKTTKVERMIEQLGLWTTEVEEVAQHEWRLEEDREGSTRAVERLAQINKMADGIDDPDLWRAADFLGRKDELVTNAEGLVDAVVAGFEPSRVPRISSLQEPAVRQKVGTSSWEPSSGFSPASETVGRYYRELGQLYDELDLEGDLASAKGGADLKEHCNTRRQVLRSYLSTQMDEWTDNWAVFRVPEGAAVRERSEVSLVDLLQTSFGSGSLHPADLPRLLGMSLSTLRARVAKMRGCHPLDTYPEGQNEYYRLDCYSYEPSEKGDGADLRIEMRVVYSAPTGGLDRFKSTLLPFEIYFLVPIPMGEDENAFVDRVMSAFRIAVQKETGLNVGLGDRTHSVKTGFLVAASDMSIRVKPTDSYPWLDGRRAFGVRAIRVGKGGMQ
jgi:hypothetical protein